MIMGMAKGGLNLSRPEAQRILREAAQDGRVGSRKRIAAGGWSSAA
jgi:hypothetical protein